MSRLARPRRKLGDLVEDQVLMAHHHHGHVATEPLAHLAGVIAGGVDDILAGDVALGRRDDPFITRASCPGCGAEANDPRPEVARALGKRLGQLRRVDVAVIGVVECACEFVGLDERIAIADLARRQDVEIHALVAAHADDALELLQALGRVPQPDRTGDVVIHRIVHRLGKPAIELGRIALHVHDRP